MQEYQIRLMTIDDYDQVYALWSITEGMALRGYDDSAEGSRLGFVAFPGKPYRRIRAVFTKTDK